MDLVSPMIHSDSLFDRLQSSLPAVTCYSTDLQVNLHSLFPQYVSPPSNEEEETLRGSLAHPNDSIIAPLINSFVVKKEKKALNELRKILIETQTKEKLLKGLPKMGAVTSKQLAALGKTL